MIAGLEPVLQVSSGEGKEFRSTNQILEIHDERLFLKTKMYLGTLWHFELFGTGMLLTIGKSII